MSSLRIDLAAIRKHIPPASSTRPSRTELVQLKRFVKAAQMVARAMELIHRAERNARVRCERAGGVRGFKLRRSNPFCLTAAKAAYRKRQIARAPGEPPSAEDRALLVFGHELHTIKAVADALVARFQQLTAVIITALQA